MLSPAARSADKAEAWLLDRSASSHPWQAGYIGSDASTTEHLRALIDSVLSGDESVVVAVQRLTHPMEREGDHQRLMHA